MPVIMAIVKALLPQIMEQMDDTAEIGKVDEDLKARLLKRIHSK